MKCIRGARIFTSVLLALTIVHSAANSRPVAKTQLVNVMPAFWAFQDELGSMKRTENIVRRFRQQIIKPNWRVYSKDEFSKNITDEGIATYIKQVQPDLSAMRSLSSRIGPQTNVALERFAQAFPQFGEVSITYLPSFYRFDGQVTKIKGEYAVLFGLDGIARYHGVDADLGVLLSHELFHIYHARTSPTLFADEEHMPLYVGVWIEGLATYVSEQLNPQASTLQILLDDKALLDRGMPMAGAIASMILEHFDSAKPEDTGRFLSFGEKDNIPGRSGYLIGYLIAKRLGADQTLLDLASLTGERLRVTMHEELRQLAATKVAMIKARPGTD